MKNAYVIVDGYSSGRMLVDAFKEQFKNDSETVIVHVLSTPVPYTTMAAPEFEKYAESIVLDGDIQSVIDQLKKYNVMAVVAGQEPGVELADTLSEKLQLKNTNGTEKSAARRNKFDMVKTIAEAGLAAPKFLKSSNLSQILDWVRENTQYPVVIKALRSAGTDGVYISSSEEELKAAFGKLIGSESIYNETNQEVLIESFLDGTEYVVNAVSMDGIHYVTDVWMYQKKFIPGHGNIYDREMLMPADSRIVQELIHYNSKVLDALDIKNGPSHAEIMYTSKGPVLVEVGARISGVVHPALLNSCVGHNQVNLTIDCYSDSKKFMELIQQSPYAMKQHGMIINMIYEGLPGTIEHIDDQVLEQIKSLSSVVQFVMRAHQGDILNPTRTLINSPARLFLGHVDEQQLYKDYDAIQQMKNKLFRIAVQPSSRPMSFMEANSKSAEPIQSAHLSADETETSQFNITV